MVNYSLKKYFAAYCPLHSIQHNQKAVGFFLAILGASIKNLDSDDMLEFLFGCSSLSLAANPRSSFEFYDIFREHR